MDKKIFSIDLNRCTGCYACAVACMDQNDLLPDSADSMWRGIESLSGNGRIQYVSIACMHCEDAPCLAACPTGAVFKSAGTNLVESDKSKCIGCHCCVAVCPFGAPKFGADGKMEKCSGCAIRVENGLLPACVRICPTRALKFDTVAGIEKGKKQRLLRVTYHDSAQA